MIKYCFESLKMHKEIEGGLLVGSLKMHFFIAHTIKSEKGRF